MLPVGLLWDIANSGVMMSFILANVVLFNIRLWVAPQLESHFTTASTQPTGLGTFMYQESYDNRGSDAYLVLAIGGLTRTAWRSSTSSSVTNERATRYFTVPPVPLISASGLHPRTNT